MKMCSGMGDWIDEDRQTWMSGCQGYSRPQRGGVPKKVAGTPEVTGVDAVRAIRSSDDCRVVKGRFRHLAAMADWQWKI